MSLHLDLQYSAQVDSEIENHLLNVASKTGLLKHLLATKYIHRFIKEKDPYPMGMISDTVYDHLCRMSALLSQVLEGEDLERGLILVILHDTPELFLNYEAKKGDNIVRRDSSVVEHVKGKKEREYDIAMTLFQDNEQMKCHYQLYYDAEGLVEGTGEVKVYDDSLRIPIIVKMVDRAEGNSYFHTKLYEWLRSGHVETPDDTSLRFMFENNQKILNGLAKESRGIPKELQFISRNILRLPEKLVEGYYDGREMIIPSEIDDYIIRV